MTFLLSFLVFLLAKLYSFMYILIPLVIFTIVSFILGINLLKVSKYNKSVSINERRRVGLLLTSFIITGFISIVLWIGFSLYSVVFLFGNYSDIDYIDQLTDGIYNELSSYDDNYFQDSDPLLIDYPEDGANIGESILVDDYVNMSINSFEIIDDSILLNITIINDSESDYEFDVGSVFVNYSESEYLFNFKGINTGEIYDIDENSQKTLDIKFDNVQTDNIIYFDYYNDTDDTYIWNVEA